MRALSLLVIGSLLACAKNGGAPAATRTDSAGVEIVVNSATDRALEWPVTPTDTLFDPATDTIIQGEARGLNIGADAHGGLVFADGGFTDRRVLRAGADGVLHQVGRRGGGPGEYGMFSTVAVSPEGEVLVADFEKRAFVRFGPDDAPLPSIPWASFGPGFVQGGGYAAGGVVTIMSEMSESTSVKSVRTLSATDTTLLAVVHEPAPKQLMYESCHVGFMGAPLFYPSPSWSGNPQMIALVTGEAYEIQVYIGGKLKRIIRRGIPPRTATRELAEQELGEGFRISIGGRTPCLIPAADIVKQQGIAPTIPNIKRISMAADGTLWVERWRVKGETPIRDLFDSTGSYVGTLTGDIPWPQAWLPDGRYVTVLADADSLPVVVRYGVGGAVRRE
jgi:hypothetical protein